MTKAPNEKWWVAVIVEQLDDTNYRLYFPDDDEVVKAT